jgi:murein DD-endopeptidase
MIKFDFAAYAKIQEKRLSKMDRLDRFRFFLLQQVGNPYIWGGENFTGADCSGSVCLAMSAACGVKIRTTAEDLFKRIFTDPVRPGEISALFVKDPTGKISHIAGYIGPSVLVNAGSSIKVLYREVITKDFPGCEFIDRSLNMIAAEKLSGSAWYDVDPETCGLFLEG